MTKDEAQARAAVLWSAAKAAAERIAGVGAMGGISPSISIFFDDDAVVRAIAEEIGTRVDTDYPPYQSVLDDGAWYRTATVVAPHVGVTINFLSREKVTVTEETKEEALAAAGGQA